MIDDAETDNIEDAAETIAEETGEAVGAAVEGAVASATAEIVDAVERAEERAENAEAVVEVLAATIAETEDARERRALEERVNECLSRVDGLEMRNSQLEAEVTALRAAPPTIALQTAEPSAPTTLQPALEETTPDPVPAPESESEAVPPVTQDKPRKKRRFLK